MTAAWLPEADIAALEAAVAKAARLAQPLRVHVAADANTAFDAGSADIGIRRRNMNDETGEPATVDLFVLDTGHPRLAASNVPWDEVPQRLGHLVRTYQVERCGRDTFRTWTRTLSDSDLHERLGLKR